MSTQSKIKEEKQTPITNIRAYQKNTIRNVNPKHNLYIIRVYNKDIILIKLGYSTKIKERLWSYYHHNPLFELVGTYYREDAQYFESTLHRTLKSSILNEWYDNSRLSYFLKLIETGIEEHIKQQDIPKNKFTSPTYTDYAKNIKDCETLSDKLEIVRNIHNPDWEVLLTYGIENDKVLLNYKEASDFYDKRNDFKSIQSKVKKTFKTEIFYSLSEIKTKLQIIYNEKGLNRKAKATDLYEFFEVKNENKYVNKIKTKGMVLK
jgi:hypothetical protein